MEEHNINSPKNRFPDTDIYCITSEEHSKGRDNTEVVMMMIDAGVKVIQYREKDKRMSEKYKQCLEIRELTRSAGIFFIVNDDVDLAMLVEADGIHLGQDDLPVEAVRKLVGNDMVIGVSTHSPSQAEDALLQGADYIGVGPIYKTYTKKDVCDPVGLGYLEFILSHISIPFVAIGGIKVDNLPEILESGAGCVAMVTEIVGADDIVGRIRGIRKIIRESKQEGRVGR